MEHPLSVDLTEEQAELEALVEAFGRSSRPGKLLHFLGKQYLSGNWSELGEFTIATEVFGRSRLTFDASQDAIARVEVHRLRKRLKEFYDSAGRDHAVQISIPHGSYVPSFTKRAVATNRAAQTGNSARLAPHRIAPARPGFPLRIATPSRQGRRWIYAVLTLAAGLFGAVYLFRSHTSSTGDHAELLSASLEESAPAFISGPAVRILCGYNGAPQTDSAGAVWGPDRFFHGGGAWHRSETPIARTSDSFLFDYWRRGDTTYDIPLQPGIYELHLYFVSSGPPTGEIDTFTVRINGAIALSGFDVDSDALGSDIADERIFRDVSPAADGKLHLALNSEMGAPVINAIEIVPGLPHKTLPIRLVMQRTSRTDRQGRLWHADDYFIGGHWSGRPLPVEGSSEPDLFSFERYGHFTYAIPVDTRDRYTLILHFAEFYFGPHAAGGGTGSRVFRVLCNGNTLLDGFDIYQEAGSLHLVSKSFSHLKPSAQGKLNITFEPIVNNATVSGIEVLDESR